MAIEPASHRARKESIMAQANLSNIACFVASMEYGVQHIGGMTRWHRPKRKGGKTMDYRITDDCINRGACEPECSNQIIRCVETTCMTNPAAGIESAEGRNSSGCTEVCPKGSLVSAPDQPKPSFTPIEPRSNARDCQIEDQAPAMTREDCYLAVLSLFFILELWRITSLPRNS